MVKTGKELTSNFWVNLYMMSFETFDFKLYLSLWEGSAKGKENLTLCN